MWYVRMFVVLATRTNRTRTNHKYRSPRLTYIAAMGFPLNFTISISDLALWVAMSALSLDSILHEFFKGIYRSVGTGKLWNRRYVFGNWASNCGLANH